MRIRGKPLQPSWPALCRASTPGNMQGCAADGSISSQIAPNGTLYVGVTSNLSRRIYEHRESLIDGFTKRYGLTRLVYYEWYDDIRQAIQREKNMKHWSRAWKARLILDFNEEWRDLYGDLA